MGGRIEVDSAPGQGTRFSVALPLPVAQAPVATPARGATGGGTITGPLQLLLVEDDPTVAEVVTGLLRAQRSEEHTSELQSLMRSSYAVFCLKKKTNNTNKNTNTTYEFHQHTKT